MEVDWELSKSLSSDGQGIRAACVLDAVLPTDSTADETPTLYATGPSADSYRIVTGNQAGTICVFHLPSGRTEWVTAAQHDHAITALLAAPDRQSYVSGCKDAIVRVMDAITHQVLFTLKGHTKPVTSLSWCTPRNGSEDLYLVTGSWDGSAKIWDYRKECLIATLPDHENSVCVLGLPVLEGSSSASIRIATGSAGIAQNNVVRNHAVRLWEVHVGTGVVTLLHHVANDHEGPIRDLATHPATGMLASCSNDGTVKLRSIENAECLSTLTSVHQQNEQHASILLSIAAVDESCLAAAAEDGQVVLWQQETAVAAPVASSATAAGPSILRHPACVWKVVAPMPNGDLATCCQDGTLRIFTRNTARYAPSAEIDAFRQQVQQAVQQQQSGPSEEDIAKLPRWEESSNLRGKSESQVQLFQKAGIAIAAQWSAASQTWIEVGQVMGTADGTDAGVVDGVRYDHVFPIEVDQPASVGGGVITLKIGYNQGENPFVAAQRFIDAHVLPQYHLAQIADYISQRAGQQAVTLGANNTGSAASFRGTPAATTGVPIAIFKYIPIKAFKVFALTDKTAATTLEKMKNKIDEFSLLNSDQMALLQHLFETLAAGSRYHASQIDTDELQIVQHMLETAEPAKVFPALDLARLVVLHPHAADHSRNDYWSHILDLTVTWCRRATTVDGPAAVAIPMLALRLFVNAFQGGVGSLEAVSARLPAILECAEDYKQSSNKNIRLPVATVLYNVCLMLHKNTTTEQAVTVIPKLIPLCKSILINKSFEGEAIYRVLAALGTVVLASPEAKAAAQALYMASVVEPAASPHGPEVKAAAKEAYSVLQ